MIKKIIKNFKVVVVLYLLLLVFFLFTSSFDEVKSFISESWWVLIVLPLLMRFYGWFTYIKQKAFEKGFNSTSKSIEKMVRFVDKKTGYSEKKYEKLKSKPVTTALEAKQIRLKFTDDQLDFIKGIDTENYHIPLFTYEKGLPGNNLIVENTEDHLYCFAKINGRNLDFFQTLQKPIAEVNESDKISSIPISSIIKLEIVDLRFGRSIKRIATKTANKFLFKLVNQASSTQINFKVFSATACKLIIYYLNEDGVLMPAVFKFPSNSRFGKDAMEALQMVKSNLKVANKLNKLDWSFLALEEDIQDINVEEDFDNFDDEETEDIDFNDASIFFGDTKKLIGYLNLLAPSDSAVASAKLSAEMLASLTQNKDLPMIISSNFNA